MPLVGNPVFGVSNAFLNAELTSEDGKIVRRGCGCGREASLSKSRKTLMGRRGLSSRLSSRGLSSCQERGRVIRGTAGEMYSAGDGSGRRFCKGKGKGPICWACEKTGHRFEDCRNEKGEQMRQQRAMRTQGNMMNPINPQEHTSPPDTRLPINVFLEFVQIEEDADGETPDSHPPSRIPDSLVGRPASGGCSMAISCIGTPSVQYGWCSNAGNRSLYAILYTTRR